MPNYGYHFARAEAHATRRLYAALLPRLVRRTVSISAPFPFAIFSYSNEAAVPEQVASIRSFLKHAGRPPKFTIVSDGSHSSRSIRLLESVDESVVVASIDDFAPAAADERLQRYLREHPTGKQLALIMSLPVNDAAFYIDSDVLFFRGACALADELKRCAAPAAYLADCQESADDRLFVEASERANPVNTGVLFLRAKLDWSIAIERFRDLTGEPTFFTNQTLTQLAMHANQAQPFDPAKFVLQLDDQFVFPDRHLSSRVILRHYVNPVRHKFWNAVLRQRDG